MNDEFVKNILHWGKKGENWLKQLPSIIKQYEEKWSLQVLPPFKLSYNYVAPVIQKDDTKAVIRIGIPWETEEFLNEVKALKLFNGEGVPMLLREDTTDPVILMELIEPGIPLSSIDDEEITIPILINLMKRIWREPPAGSSFITISEWTRDLKKYLTSNNTAIPMAIAQEGMDLFTELIASTKRVVVTHADLHHDNVLLSKNDEWVAIDPKGIVADPLYDTTALIRNPYEKVSKLAEDELDHLFEKRIQMLARELDADPKRIQKWCLAQTILSAVWTVDVKEYVNFSLRNISALKRIQTLF